MNNSENGMPSREGLLKRDVSIFGAVMMGLGSIIGTGVFVSIGIAAGVAGPSVILAILIAAVVALCNAFSSAQLAANHSLSGGTYEYGYRYLNPVLGFTAGWMFLCAKTASAATAALGFAGYLLYSFYGKTTQALLIGVAAITVIILTGIVFTGIRRSNHVNIAIVSVTLTALLAFIITGLPSAIHSGATYLFPFFATSQGENEVLRPLLHATALMFVAYTGYGRIATLGEEVKNPRITIPRAIGITMLISALLYIGVGVVAIMTVGAPALAAATQGNAAPLDTVSRLFIWPQVHWVVAIGAMTAMLGVLLNLILGLSRVLLAMGRRGDMPHVVSRLNTSQTTPVIAVPVMGIAILLLTLTGNIKLAWSFSAFTVLMYYAITNLAALRLKKEDRLYSPVFAWSGLFSCLFLAFWVEFYVWMAGIGLILAGLVWQKMFRLVPALFKRL